MGLEAPLVVTWAGEPEVVLVEELELELELAAEPEDEPVLLVLEELLVVAIALAWKAEKELAEESLLRR